MVLIVRNMKDKHTDAIIQVDDWTRCCTGDRDHDIYYITDEEFDELVHWLEDLWHEQPNISSEKEWELWLKACKNKFKWLKELCKKMQVPNTDERFYNDLFLIVQGQAVSVFK